MHAQPQQTVRRHHLRHVLHNIKQDSEHYKKALILTTSSRSVRSERPACARMDRATQHATFQTARIRCI
jgi:hypothetical protein